MTLLLQRDTKPGLHALVIGVCPYEYAHHDVQSGWLLPAVNASALRIVEWLATRYRNPTAELASIDLISSKGDCPWLPHVPGYIGRYVNAPKHQWVESAVADWMRRAGRHEDNIALLYYAGPGFARGADTLLQFDDFSGPARGGAVRGMASFLSVPMAMRSCPARRQIFLLDLDRGDAPGDLVVDPLMRVRPADSASPCQAVIHAASLGQRALAGVAGPDAATLFAEALIGSLDALEPDPSTGAVSVSRLAAAVTAEVARTAAEHGLEQRPDALLSGDFDFHYSGDPGAAGGPIIVAPTAAPAPAAPAVDVGPDGVEDRPNRPALPGGELDKVRQWIARQRDPLAVQVLGGVLAGVILLGIAAIAAGLL